MPCSCLTHRMQSSCPVQDFCPSYLCQATVPRLGKQRELVCTELSGEDGHQAELQCTVTNAMLGTSSPAMTQRRTKKSKRAFQSAKPGRLRQVGGVQRESPAETCLSSIAHGNCLIVLTIQGCTITSGSWLAPNPCVPSPS